MTGGTISLNLMFQAANFTALAGWLLLAFSPKIPVWADRISGFAIPAVLAIVYTGLLLAFWSGTEGGFDTLDNVMLVFTRPELVLAGWFHYLAFDLVVGAWEARTGRKENIPFLIVLPCLALTFIFGPVGFLLFIAVRAGRAATRTAPSGTP